MLSPELYSWRLGFRYLAEFCYRFNRRFQLEDMLPRFVYTRGV